jgi:hypothetical protein
MSFLIYHLQLSECIYPLLMFNLVNTEPVMHQGAQVRRAHKTIAMKHANLEKKCFTST